jgi:hypothetical protein
MENLVVASTAAQLIDSLEAAGGHQPGPGIIGYTFFRPLAQGGHKGFLQGIFSQVKVPQQTNQCSQYPAGFPGKQGINLSGKSRAIHDNAT